MELISALGIAGSVVEIVLGFLIRYFRDRIQDFIISHKDIFTKKQEETLKDYSGILPIDHSGCNYIYDSENKNIDIVDKGTSFIIPETSDGEWYVFGEKPSQDGMKALLEILNPILSSESANKNLDETFSPDKLEDLIEQARKEASEYQNTQEEKSLFGISRIMLNRKGELEIPWCNLLVYKTNLYTRNVMHILFNKLFPNGHNEAISNIEDIHLLYPFIYELKLSISLISEGAEGSRIILKRAPYEYFEQKDVSDKWILYASESIGQEDLENNAVNLEDAVIKRLKNYKIEMDYERIDFHDIFFVKEQLSVSVLTSAVVSHHTCIGAEKAVTLDVNGIFDFLNKYRDDTADYCKYSLVMWLSRHCMEDA